ncbi:hypothetical protein [Streptomyces marincola]|uniref:Uncharacterized protein n=1 Tax=Streptomyces marincola TaxID=2878388 RepID=A0A1W7D2E3_9ACTN|nr:hypothetical protein [Streptomyces marincola]ARQ71241.1 hypothetical protein CAG99_22595 [Streptomyces marincola]
MGWTVLYIAFGVVALWLLGEVLLQYKARLRWRLIAFTGFLGVVIGVLLSNVPVIALGAVAFATGQTFVTLSFRRGFSTGWALGGRPGTSKRRRAERSGAARERPVPPRPDDPVGPPPEEGPATAQFAAIGAPDDGDGDGGHAADRGHAAEDGGSHDGRYGGSYDGPYPGPRDDVPAAGGHPPADYAESYAQEAYDAYGEGGQAPAGAGDSYGYAGSYLAGTPGWAPAEESWAAPSFPAADAAGTQSYGDPAYPRDQHAAERAGYGEDPGGAAGWPAAGGGDPYYQETPPGGVWVPQQRDPAGAAPGTGYGYPPQEPPRPEHPGQGQQDPQGQGYYFTDGQRY